MSGNLSCGIRYFGWLPGDWGKGNRIVLITFSNEALGKHTDMWTEVLCELQWLQQLFSSVVLGLSYIPISAPESSLSVSLYLVVDQNCHSKPVLPSHTQIHTHTQHLIHTLTSNDPSVIFTGFQKAQAHTSDLDIVIALTVQSVVLRFCVISMYRRVQHICEQDRDEDDR